MLWLFCLGLSKLFLWPLSTNIYLIKVNNRNARKRRAICSKLTMKTTEWWVPLLLTLNKFHTFSRASIVNFEQVNVCRVRSHYYRKSLNRGYDFHCVFIGKSLISIITTEPLMSFMKPMLSKIFQTINYVNISKF